VPGPSENPTQPETLKNKNETLPQICPEMVVLAAVPSLRTESVPLAEMETMNRCRAPFIVIVPASRKGENPMPTAADAPI
jgi:hypothetical protein